MNVSWYIWRYWCEPFPRWGFKYITFQELYTPFALVEFCCDYLSYGWVYPYHWGLLHWYWSQSNDMIAPAPMKQPGGIWVNKSHVSTKNSSYNFNKWYHNIYICILYGIYELCTRWPLFSSIHSWSMTQPSTMPFQGHISLWAYNWNIENIPYHVIIILMTQ